MYSTLKETTKFCSFSDFCNGQLDCFPRYFLPVSTHLINCFVNSASFQTAVVRFSKFQKTFQSQEIFFESVSFKDKQVQYIYQLYKISLLVMNVCPRKIVFRAQKVYGSLRNARLVSISVSQLTSVSESLGGLDSVMMCSLLVGDLLSPSDSCLTVSLVSDSDSPSES